MKPAAQLLLLIAFLIIASGCVTPPPTQPKFADPAFQQSPPGELRLLPVLDVRADKKSSVELERNIRKYFAAKVSSRGFRVELTAWPDSKTLPAAAALANLTPAEMIAYLPPGTTPIVIITLDEELETHGVFAKETIAVVSAKIVDPETARILWKNTGGGSFLVGDPLMLSVAITPATMYALRNAVDSLASALPAHK